MFRARIPFIVAATAALTAAIGASPNQSTAHAKAPATTTALDR